MHDNPSPTPALNRALPAARRSRRRWLSVWSCLLCMTQVFADDVSDAWIRGVWQGPDLGQPISREAMHDFPRHVHADGNGLPAGEGNALEGAALYAQQCARCHGNRGQGGKAMELVGDRSLLATEFPDRGIAVFWPNASTLFEYVYRSMPPERPATFSANQVYAILAHVLELNELLAPGRSLNAATLSAIKMPNRDGFRTLAH